MAGQREKKLMFFLFFPVVSRRASLCYFSLLLAVMVNVPVPKILSSGIEEDSNDLPDGYEGIKPVRIQRIRRESASRHATPCLCKCSAERTCSLRRANVSSRTVPSFSACALPEIHFRNLYTIYVSAYNVVDFRE